MTAFPKYPAYKSSGVEWLGDVPEHWEANRVFSIFNERVETGQGQLPILSVTISNGVQVEQFEGDRKKRLIEDRDAYKRAAAGDIAYNTMRMWQGAVGDVPVDGLVSPAYVVAKPIKDINSRYYSFLFRGEMFQVETNRHSYGIVSDRNRLYWLGFKNIVVPIPPRAEQDRIVAFLDEKTAEIDRLIAKKQRQIELLDEQKAILINRAVTRGLHPHTELQDSGIPWIGPIPKHWKVLPFRRLIDSICDGPFGSGLTSAHYTETGTRVIRLGNIGKAVFKNDDKAFISPVYAKQLDHHSVQRGDLLVAGLGDGNHPVGRACIYERDEPAIVKADCYRVRLNDQRLNQYVCHFLSSRAGAAGFAAQTRGSTRSRVNLEITREVPVVVPDTTEADAIASFIVAASTDSLRASSAIESQIQTLQTLRSTLIAHAVTGKIKVS